MAKPKFPVKGEEEAEDGKFVPFWAKKGKKKVTKKKVAKKPAKK